MKGGLRKQREKISDGKVELVEVTHMISTLEKLGLP